MKTQFEIYDSFRMLASEDLVEMLIQKKEPERDLFLSFEESSLMNILLKLTPAKRKIAMAAVELYKREQSKLESCPKVQSSNDIYKLMKPILADLQNEELWVMFLNNGLKVTNCVRMSVGGYCGTIADTRFILKKALENNATAIALIHNHPSGNVHPSAHDNNLTDKVNVAARMMEIRLIDHVIIGLDTYYSYSDDGKI